MTLRAAARSSLVLALAFCLGLVGACDQSDEKATKSAKELLVYCGITMVKPMTEIAGIIEKKHGAKITITQGGSEDLYQSLALSKVGDLYLPGSLSYRENHLKEGLLGDFVHVGFNKAAMMVKKGNPRNVGSDIKEILRTDLALVICNPESGSIGRETKKILDNAGIYDQAFAKAAYLTTDSRNLNAALRQGDADVILNWRATAFFPENQASTQVIELDPKIATPKKLVINLLTFSKYPDIAKAFMAFAASEEGQAIFRKHGFLDANMKGN